MITTIFHAIISRPLYNGLIVLMKTLPFFDAGVIVIIFTIIIKIILLPLSLKASRAQIEMKSHEKNLNELKEKYKDNKEEYGKKQLEYYKEKGINPFASLLIIIIQLPILIGLYRIFINSGLPAINNALIYSFVSAPAASVSMIFLGLLNISQKSLILAVIAGITTYFQISLSTGASPSSGDQGDIAKAMQVQMKYFFPILMTYIAYIISGAVALYLITSNLFAIGQEIYVRRKYHKSVFVE